MTSSRLTANQIGAELQYKREILMLEDGEGTMKWAVTGTGTGYGVTHDPTAAYFGTNGIKMVTRVTDAAEDDQCKATRQFCYPITDMLLIRARVSLPDFSTMKNFCLCLDYIDGSHRWNAGINYRPNTKKLQYRNSSNLWTDIAGYGQTLYDGFWTILEYAMDLGNQRYIYVIFNGIRTELTDKAYSDLGAVEYMKMLMDIGINTAGAAQTELHMDALYIGELENI